MVDKIDHIERGIGRLATQFKSSENLINYIKSLLSEANTLEQVFCDLLDKRWLDTAEGVQLDIIGAIVGQGREFIDAEIFAYFGFFNNFQAQGFGSLGNPSLGGRFRAVDEETLGLRLLSDDEYRLFIKARIARNSTSSTPEEIISQIKFLFDSPLVLISEGAASYQISIGKVLSLNEKAILLNTDIVPKTAGVTVSYVTEFDGNDFFGFAGVPGASGFGSVSNPSLGGTFGNLI